MIGLRGVVEGASVVCAGDIDYIYRFVLITLWTLNTDDLVIYVI